MSSTTLTQDTNVSLSGINLKWVHAGLGTIREITLVYYQNTPSASIFSVDISPAVLKYNLKNNYTSGASYSFQLQVTDTAGLTIYSNILSLTAPYFLSSPSILSVTPGDNKLIVSLDATTNILNAIASDSVEFVFRRESDNFVFWKVMPFSATNSYTVTDANISNYNNYLVACMFQTNASNSSYKGSNSSISNTIQASPTNIPNSVGSVTGVSVGNLTYNAKFTWTKPSDFAEWSANGFTITVLLTDSIGRTSTFTTSSDVLEHTFTNLTAGLSFKATVTYTNINGTSPAIDSEFISLTKLASPPVIDTTSELDGSFQINFSCLDDGQDTLTGYRLYKDNDEFVEFYSTIDLTKEITILSLTNGVQYSYYLTTLNSVGESSKSLLATGTPFGPMSIVSSIATGKTLSVTIRPNGRPVERVIMLAIDQDPTEELVANSIFDIPQLQISQVTNADIVVTKTFSTLSSDISFHLAVVHCNSVVQFIKSA